MIRTAELATARARLVDPPKRRGSARAALGAAALASVSALGLSAAVVVAAVSAPQPRAAVRLAATPVAAEERRAD